MAHPSRNFFAVFSLLIILSVSIIFKEIYIKHNYTQYASYEDVPSTRELYEDVYQNFVSLFKK